MKAANMLFLAVLVISFIPQIGVIYTILSKTNWAKGKKLFIDSIVIWTVWVLTTILTGIFLIETGETTYKLLDIPFIVRLIFLRLLVLTFVSTGVTAGVLYLLKNYFRQESVLQGIWRKSVVISISTNSAFYTLMIISFMALTYFFGTF